MIDVLAYPQIDPVLVRIGPLAIRWYSLAYLAGLLFGWWYLKRLVRVARLSLAQQAVDDFLLYATFGVILGGRLGYVIFYKPSLYLSDPLEIVRLWDGGMSFHGGLIGVAVAILLFARRFQVAVLRFSDLVAVVAPIGLFFGRLANFINGELWGRPADLPWAMVFPRDPLQIPRHPSQIYEATLEGLLLFAILNFLFWRRPAWRQREGGLTGVFLAGYGTARFLVEYTRAPDSFLGLIAGVMSMGQILSLPLILAGLWLIVRARRTDGTQ
ncbi:MAG: prolipoprotein diacylglyceryl transferase [Alphaproteobacteria bacterium]|nr:MAG: prolipoprotein diacylglyceryl transferase [Alphaproteobacteria bacterium]